MLPRWLFAALLVAVGCAGELSDPDRFETDSPGADASPAGACDVETDILAARCSGAVCHDADNPAAGLDLASSGVGARLLDVASGCNGRLLIDSANGPNSYLLEKLQPAPECGGQMPIGGSLSAADLTCVQDWVTSL